MNHVQLVGRLTKDLKVRKTASGKSVASFNLAVPRRSKDDGTDFISMVAWGKPAEVLSKYVKKGDRLGVSGRISTRDYEKDGRKVYVTEVVVEDFDFLEKKDKQTTSNEPIPQVQVEDYPDDLPF